MNETETAKAPVRLDKFDDLIFSPRFEYGHMAELAPVTGSSDGTTLGTGYVRLKAARIPWEIFYDEVITVIEGQLTVHVGEVAHVLNPRDSIWLPSGTALIYESEEALAFYAVQPQTW